MKSFLRLLAAALMVFGLAGHAANASLRVNPLIIYLQPTGSGTSQVIQLTNVTDIELPFEVNVVKRTVIDGSEVDVPADDDFVIFPPQMIIQPGATQTLRVQFLPGTPLSKSESYYIYVTQIPVELRPGMSGIRINYRFGISAHVVPSGVEPALQVDGYEEAVNEEGLKGHEVIVTNTGTRFARLSETGLDIPGGPSLDDKEVKERIGTGFLLPGQTARYFIAAEAGSVVTEEPDQDESEAR